MSLSGYSDNSPEDAMDVAAARVIRYMETVRSKVLKDYNYDELQQTKQRELHLISLLEKKEKELKEQGLKMKELSSGFADYLCQVKSISSEINSKVKESVCLPNSMGNTRLSKATTDIHNELARLNQLTDSSMQLIHNARVYPFQVGSTSTNHLTSENSNGTGYTNYL